MALQPVDFKSTALPIRANPPIKKQSLVHGSCFVDHPASTQLIISKPGGEMQGKNRNLIDSLLSGLSDQLSIQSRTETELLKKSRNRFKIIDSKFKI
jgi:hypothetical protein